MVFSRLHTTYLTYLLLALVSMGLMPHTVLSTVDSVPAENQQEENAPQTPKPWQKKQKKKPTIVQSWKKVFTGDWASLNKYDNRNLAMSAVALGSVYTFYYYCLRSTAPTVNTNQQNGQDNQVQSVEQNGQDNQNTIQNGHINPPKPKKQTYPLSKAVVEENRVMRAVAVPQSGNALCGVYSAHNADAALTFIRSLDHTALNNDTITAVLTQLNQHLLASKNTLDARLQNSPDNSNKKTNWTAQVCHSRKYNIYKRAFFTCICRGFTQAEKQRKQTTQTGWERFISLFFSTPFTLQKEDEQAISRIADVFTQYIMQGNSINFDTLDATNFKTIYEHSLPPLDDPNAMKKYGVNSTLTAYNKRQRDCENIALQQAVQNNFKTTFGSNMQDNTQRAQQLTPFIKGTNFSNDLSGNNLDSGEIQKLLETVDRTYTILTEDALNGANKEIIAAFKDENPEAFDTNYKITVIDKTNANQAGYYRQALNEIRNTMYQSNKTFAHTFLIRQDYQAPITQDDDTTQVTAAASASHSTHWTTLMVLRITHGTTMTNYYVAIDSLNSIALDNQSHKDIIEFLEIPPTITH